MPLVALHGVRVDHRELEAALEPMLADSDCHRIYPALPAMGHSTATGLRSNNGVVALLAGVIEQVADEPALLLGHSCGAYLARGIAAPQRPESLRGVALVCPLTETTGQVPPPEVVVQSKAAYDELEPDQHGSFDDYFVVRTPATGRRFRDYTAPGMSLVDDPALTAIFGDWPIDMRRHTFSCPTLVAAGLHGITVGFDDAVQLLDVYPRSTLAVVDGAGHAMLHERPDIVTALLTLTDRIGRTRADTG